MTTTIIVIILIYLVFRILRVATVFTMRSASGSRNDFKEPEPAPKPNKMIKKDEGEYVDYEEVRK